MPTDSIWDFYLDNMKSEDFRGKRVLEIGSYHKFGGIRNFVEKYMQPSLYIGVDIRPGHNVDVIARLDDLLKIFNNVYFDIIILTEVMEHIKDYISAVGIIKKLLSNNGLVYITTRSYGFGIHYAPLDYWRYEISDMQTLFSDFNILKLERDNQFPGIFLVARKESLFDENLVQVPTDGLYSILIGKKTTNVIEITQARTIVKLTFLLHNSNFKLFHYAGAVINHFII